MTPVWTIVAFWAGAVIGMFCGWRIHYIADDIVSRAERRVADRLNKELGVK